jgi:PAS domain S-box-containing protein
VPDSASTAGRADLPASGDAPRTGRRRAVSDAAGATDASGNGRAAAGSVAGISQDGARPPSPQQALLLYDIALAASGEEDLYRILSAALDRLSNVVRFTGGSISLVEGEELVLSAAIGPFTSRSIGQRLPRGSGQSWKIVDSQQPWLCDDLRQAGYQIRGVDRDSGPRSYLAVPLVRQGETIGLLQIDSVDPGAFSEPDLELLQAVAVALTGPIELARRHRREAAALLESHAAQARLRLLAEASSVLASSVDYESTLDRVAHLALPLLGTYCVVDLIEGDGTPRQVAVAHADASQEPVLREIRVRYPFDPSLPYGVMNVLRTGEPEIRNDIDGEWMEQTARDARHLELLRQLQFHAYAIVPMIVRGRTVGALSFVSSDADRAYTSSDVELASDLARRTAAAVDIARLYRESQESRSLLGTLFATAPVGLGYWDHDLRFVRVNEALAAMNGVRPEDHVGKRVDEVAPALAPAMTESFQQVLRTGSPLVNVELSGETPARPGEVSHWLVSYYPVTGGEGRVLGLGSVVVDVTDHKRAEEERDVLLAQERRARAESEAASTRLALLADASAVLTSLDYETTLQSVAEIAVPGLADWCVIEIVQDDGTVRRLALVHADRQRELADELLRRFPPADPGSSPLLRSVLETGNPILLPDVPESVLEQLAQSPEHLELIHKLGLRSGMVVPLPGHERVLGAIAFVSTRPGRRYGEADLATAQELARRAATAVERSRLHGELSRFRSTVDSVLDGVLMFDPATLRFFYANEGAVNLTGYSREELLRMTPLDLEPDLDEPRFRRVVEPLVAGAASTTVTTTHRRKDGRSIMVELFLQYVAPVGERGRIVVVLRDITDRIEARARLQRLAQSERARNAELRAIIRAMGDAVLVIEPDGKVNLANPAAEAMFADERINQYEQLVSRLEDPEGRVPTLEALAGQGPVEFRLAAGDERWVELSAYPVFTPREAPTEDGMEADVLETIVFIRDITEARRSRTMRDAFIGVLSHELRTPVTTIFGNSKLLVRPESRLEEDTRREVLSDIENEAERLYRLVEDLLVLARFERAPGRVGREPVLMQRVVPIVIRSERSRFPMTRFESRIQPGVPTVQADPTYVEQVVRNLISNAAKYGGANKTVQVTVAAEDDEVLIRVLDEGPGFPEEEAARLFELFYRSPRTSAMAGGAGIGLFVCKRLIEAMGGRMWANARPTGGAEFGFALKVFDEEGE